MDLQVIETGNGGDVVKNAKDLSMFEGFQNMPYLAMFGGNIEQSTPQKRNLSEQAFDWWGNNLLFPNDKSVQFNSETERAINTIPLTSAGRGLIENAIRKDLDFLKDFINVDVQVSITATDRIEWLITLTKPNNLQSTAFVYIWDATKKELSIIGDAPGNAIPFGASSFDFSFDGSFF